MTWPVRTFRLLAVLAWIMLLFFPGCDGSAPRQQVDDTVKGFSGQKSVERMDQIKKDIGEIQSRQADRMRQIEDGDGK